MLNHEVKSIVQIKRQSECVVFIEAVWQYFKMKKSGKTNRAEPSDLSWVNKFPDCAQLFAEAGWLVFFEKIEGYHSYVSYKFA